MSTACMRVSLHKATHAEKGIPVVLICIGKEGRPYVRVLTEYVAVAMKISNLLASVYVLRAAANKKTNPSTTVAIFCMSIGTVMRT
jgi:hypothetical protein